MQDSTACRLQKLCTAHIFFGKPFFQNPEPFYAQFDHFGSSFGATFAPLGSFWEHFGYIFCMKNRTEAPKVLQERPKALTPEINSRFGSHSEGIFLTFAGKMYVFVVLFAVLFFSSIFESP